jgi:3-oxoadipate enol-lactonase
MCGLYCETAGAGFPLVLISGGGVLDRRGWDEEFGTLAADCQVVRYDVRGIGRSERPTESFSHSVGGELAKALDALVLDEN